MGASLSNNKRGGRRRRGGSSYQAMAEINVTPMVDVMLVLLIVFMVAAPLLTAGVPIDLPNSKAKPIQNEDNDPIEITVDQDGNLYLGESLVKEENLISVLTPMMEGQEDARIYIRADQSLNYGRVMSVLGLINGAGFSHVALISKAK